MCCEIVVRIVVVGKQGCEGLVGAHLWRYGLMVVVVVEVMMSWEMLSIAVDVELVDVVAVEVVEVVDTLGVDV